MKTIIKLVIVTVVVWNSVLGVYEKVHSNQQAVAQLSKDLSEMGKRTSERAQVTNEVIEWASR